MKTKQKTILNKLIATHLKNLLNLKWKIVVAACNNIWLLQDNIWVRKLKMIWIHIIYLIELFIRLKLIVRLKDLWGGIYKTRILKVLKKCKICFMDRWIFKNLNLNWTNEWIQLKVQQWNNFKMKKELWKNWDLIKLKLKKFWIKLILKKKLFWKSFLYVIRNLQEIHTLYLVIQILIGLLILEKILTLKLTGSKWLWAVL